MTLVLSPCKYIKGSESHLCKEHYGVYTSGMNKTHALVLISLASLIGVAPCLASEPETKQAIAVMGGQAIPTTVDDAAIQKAIETLIKQQQNQVIDIRKKIPNKLDNPVGEHPLRYSDKVMILGGAEAMPM